MNLLHNYAKYAGKRDRKKKKGERDKNHKNVAKW